MAKKRASVAGTTAAKKRAARPAAKKKASAKKKAAAKKKRAAKPAGVSALHLARITKFSERHIRDLEKQGVVVKAGRSQYLEVESLAAMVQHYANPKSKSTINTATLKLREEQALLAQRKREQLEGALIAAADAEAAIAEYIVQINRLAQGLRSEATTRARTIGKAKLPAWVLDLLDDVGLRMCQAGQSVRIGEDDEDP